MGDGKTAAHFDKKHVNLLFCVKSIVRTKMLQETGTVRSDSLSCGHGYFASRCSSFSRRRTNSASPENSAPRKLLITSMAV